MRRSILSERNLVIILFVMVVVIFSFAQADTNKIEKMYFNAGVPVSVSPGPSQTTKDYTQTEETSSIRPVSQLR